MNNLLLSERWRPKTIDEIILLPRIKNLFEDGLRQNVIFHGHFGTGKTTLSRILIGKYLRNSPYLEINSSFYTSIETLRSKIDDFCSKVYMGFDLNEQVSKDTLKYVFLDEFERTSIQYQDALKAYIEEYSSKNVRFILTTNHINKVSPGIRSRLFEVNFDCQDADEEKYLKNEIAKKIIKEIAPNEKFEISKEDVIKIINKKFPDFRAILLELENYKSTGRFSEKSNVTNLKIRSELYQLVFQKSITFEEIFNFISNKIGQDNIEQIFELFGKPFFEFCIENKNCSIENLFKIAYIVTDYKKMIDTSLDPIVLGITVVGKIRELF